MRINHCGAKRRTTLLWLTSRQDKFDYEAVFKATCPKCKQDILEVCGFTYEQGFTPTHRIRHRDREAWEERIKVDFLEKREPEQKEARPLIFVSEYTLKISRGPSLDFSFLSTSTNTPASKPGFCFINV